MKNIYQVTICGSTIESRDLRQLLARAVSEKRSMDRRLRFLPAFGTMPACVDNSYALPASRERQRAS
jgi:hypothetical protein